MSHSKIILVAGPTAAGKSAFALALAASNNGTIINADAMQVYTGLPILTNQPDAATRATVPHELYGTLDPATPCSAGIWRTLAIEAVTAALQAGRTPILVGGTGLYFRALFGGLADIPPVPDEVRVATQTLYDEIGEERFRTQLARHDPNSAKRLARNDRQRLIRAYEVVTHTGRPLGDWHRTGGINPFGTAEIEPHLILPKREDLYAACDQRFAEMIETGAISEAADFLARKLRPALPAMKTIGLREISGYLAGEWSKDEAVAKAQQATRNYAKRQLTWFRNQPLITPHAP